VRREIRREKSTQSTPYFMFSFQFQYVLWFVRSQFSLTINTESSSDSSRSRKGKSRRVIANECEKNSLFFMLTTHNSQLTENWGEEYFYLDIHAMHVCEMLKCIMLLNRIGEKNKTKNEKAWITEQIQSSLNRENRENRKQ
jgi:hypothetical protein